MPELTTEAQLLCDSSALEECGDAVTFEVLEWRRPASAFALRFDGEVVAYLNLCAHVPSEMDWQPGKFWDQDRRFIICSVHGALYDPPNGHCVSGPCVGKHLIKLTVQERDQQVYWYPSDRVQPAFLSGGQPL
ncbi:MAG: Rieske 2Fe-2S domain-containing protein [Burkholderiales bacterium]|nr:Rieske 2Fe-2S domain-containing protein [Burkholderiales bacterium]